MWHPLGFVSLPLKEGNGWALKLHYWPKGVRKPKSPDWQIHDHRFHIESRVLYGTIGNWIYRIEEGGDSRLFPVSYSGKDSILESNGLPVTAILEKEDYHKAGTVYEISRSVFHQAYVPLDSSVMTIVLQTDFVEKPPFVVGKNDVPIETYKRTCYDQSKLWREIKYGPK